MTNTARSARFRSPASSAAGRLSGSALAASVFLLLPPVVILIAGALTRGLGGTSVVAVAAGVLVVSASVCAVRRTAAFLVCGTDSVVVGFAPLWRTRLPAHVLDAVDRVEVDAFAEYGGWGIKGRVREDRGRLYSAGGRHAVRLRSLDGQTFLVAFSDRDEAERARAAVADLLSQRLQASVD